MTSTNAEINFNPWEHVPAFPASAPRPSILAHVQRREDQRTLCGLGLEVLLAEPTVGTAFAGRVFERLRARIDTATPDEQNRLRALDQALSRHVGALAELGRALAVHGHVLESLRAQHRELGALLVRIDGTTRAKDVTA